MLATKKKEKEGIAGRETHMQKQRSIIKHNNYPEVQVNLIGVSSTRGEWWRVEAEVGGRSLIIKRKFMCNI